MTEKQQVEATHLDCQIAASKKIIAELDEKLNGEKPLAGFSRVATAIERNSAKKLLNSLLSQRIDELIQEFDRVDGELSLMRASRMQVTDQRLLHKYDELEAVKERLSKLQLQQIEGQK